MRLATLSEVTGASRGIVGSQALGLQGAHTTTPPEPCGQETPRENGEDWDRETTSVTGIAKQQDPLTCFLNVFLHLGRKDAAHSRRFSGIFSNTRATLPFHRGLTGQRCVAGASHSVCKSKPDIGGLMEERDSISQSPMLPASESDSQTRV